MIFDSEDTMTAAGRQISTGPPTGFVENFGPSSKLSMEADRSISEVDARMRIIGQLHESYSQVGLSLGVPNPQIGDPETRLRKWHENLQKQSKDNPEIAAQLPTFDSLWEQHRTEVQGLQTDVTDVGGRATLAGTLGQMAGSMAAIATDPPILLSMFAGAPLASSILKGALVEAGIGMGVEVALQPQVQSFREELGLKSGLEQAALNVLAAGGGAAAFYTAFRMTGTGVSQLLQQAKKLQNPTPEVRSAIEHLETLQEIDAASPLVSQPNASREHQQRFDSSIQAVSEGRRADLEEHVAPIKQDQSVVVSRTLPDLSEELSLRADVVAVRTALDDMRRGLHQAQTRTIRGTRAEAPLPQGDKIISDYVDGGLAFSMNAISRATTPGELAQAKSLFGISDDQIPALLRSAEDLDQQLRTTQAEVSRVYRGLSLPEVPKVGDVVQEKGFLSTAKDRDVAEDFVGIGVDQTGGQPVLYQIDVPQGVSGRDLTTVEGIGDKMMRDFQQEVLFPRNSRVRVKSVEWDPDSQAYVAKVDLLPDPMPNKGPRTNAAEPSPRAQDASPAEARDGARAEEASGRYEELDGAVDKVTDADMATIGRMLEEDQDLLIYREDADGDLKQVKMSEVMDELAQEERAITEFKKCSGQGSDSA